MQATHARTPRNPAQVPAHASGDAQCATVACMHACMRAYMRERACRAMHAPAGHCQEVQPGGGAGRAYPRPDSGPPSGWVELCHFLYVISSVRISKFRIYAWINGWVRVGTCTPHECLMFIYTHVFACVVHRTHALPPRYPPGLFVLIAHGGQNICFNKPRFDPFYLIF
jgi:hypothetical protein